MGHTRSPKKVASVGDTAVDFAGMGKATTEQYVHERDANLIKAKPGEKVTWFYLRRIPTSVYTRYVMEAAGTSERHKRAFQAAVTRIDNLVDVDGEYVPSWAPRGKIQTPNGEIDFCTEQELERIAPVFVEDIGSVADFLAYLPPGRKHRLRLPRYCASALAQNLTLYAADQLATARSFLNNKQHTPPAPPSKTTSDGDAPTDADATESRTDTSGESE